MQRYKDLVKKTKADLIEDLRSLKKEQMNLRFQKAYGQVEKPHQIRVVRRNIAKYKTALTQAVLKESKNA